MRRKLTDDLGRPSPNGRPGPEGDFWLAMALIFVVFVVSGGLLYWWFR